MKKYHILTLIGLTVALMVVAEGRPRRASGSLFPETARWSKKSAAPSAAVPRIVAELEPDGPVAVPDTVSVAYYLNTVKQNGWMRGLGKPLTPEQIKHLGSYYRFSKRNKAGHFTVVESFDGFGNPVNGNMATYIAAPQREDSLLNPVWKDKLSSIVRWDLIGDESGENCIGEKAYDVYGNLVYSYTPVPVGENLYMGHYVDAWGLPAKFRGGNAATYVLIHRNADGYEERVDFLGREGFFRENFWGSYMNLYEHSPEGFNRSHRSALPDGSFMLDNSSNCGMLQEFDEYGNVIDAINIDEYGRPIRVNVGKPGEDDYVRVQQDYDEYGRLISGRYLTAKGEPDTTHNGIHSYYATYSGHGTVKDYWLHGLDGKFRNGDNGLAQTRREIDESDDYQLGISILDADNCPVAYFDTGASDIAWKRDTTSTTRFETRHFLRLPDGRRMDTYLDCRVDSIGYVAKPLDNLVTFYYYDDKNRNTGVANYDVSGNPRRGERGYHAMIIEYVEKPGWSKETTIFYDSDGSLMVPGTPGFTEWDGRANRRVEESDSIAKVCIIKMYDGDRIIMNYMQPRTSDFDFALGEVGLDIMGRPARTHLEQALYYNSFTGSKHNGYGFSYIGITNEYGEPAYAIDNDGSTTGVYAFRPLSAEPDKDENGESIYDSEEFYLQLPKVQIIEVYDSIAERYGIRSGDVLVKYGSYGTGKTLTDMTLGESTWMYASLDSRDKEKDMIVMRRNPEANDGEWVRIRLPKGMPGDFGFYYHTFPYTKREARRYDDVVKRFTEETGEVVQIPQPDPMNEWIGIRPSRVFGETQNAYKSGMHDQAILLGYKIWTKDGGALHHTGPTNLNKLSRAFLSEKDGAIVWYTTDGYTIDSISVSGNTGFGTYATDRIYIPKRDQKRMEKLEEKTKLLDERASKPKAGSGEREPRPEIQPVVLGRVEGEEGWFPEHGLSGLYIVLEYNEWNIYDDIAEFSRIFEASRSGHRRITLSPIDDNGNIGDSFTLNLEPGEMMGLRVMDYNVGKDYFTEYIHKPYYRSRHGDIPNVNRFREVYDIGF